MPIFEYRCPECRLLNEHITMTPSGPPQKISCKRCGAEAIKTDYPSSISLARSGMDNAPLDNAIGKDAEKRWGAIHARQAIRDSVRKETGEVGLSKVGQDKFVPVTSAQKELRTSVNETVATAGGYAKFTGSKT